MCSVVKKVSVSTYNEYVLALIWFFGVFDLEKEVLSDSCSLVIYYYNCFLKFNQLVYGGAISLYDQAIIYATLYN